MLSAVVPWQSTVSASAATRFSRSGCDEQAPDVRHEVHLCAGDTVARGALSRVLAGQGSGHVSQSRPLTRRRRRLFPPELIARARNNADTQAWAAQCAMASWPRRSRGCRLSDDELWDLMFSNSIKRSWMVWSNGHCPACQQPVPMYEWVIHALAQPWKVQCPHCQEFFPKNDFQKFYRSGLNEQGVFEPARADRSLLFNVEHPDPTDPLHRFGVDDGEGYVAGEKRWRFIGAYLIYGQWKQAIVAGVRQLAAAYLVTGDPAYAHKAGVLLDRVADLYPTFDFGQEGVMYEGPPSAGYVSTWHDACVEVYELAIAYDVVFEAIARDESLIAFLSAKAARHKLANDKSSFAEHPAEHRRADPARHGRESPEDRVELSDHRYHDRHDPDRARLAEQPRRSDGDPRPDHSSRPRPSTACRARKASPATPQSPRGPLPNCSGATTGWIRAFWRRRSSVIRSSTPCTGFTSTPGASGRTTRAPATRERSRSSARTTPASTPRAA